MTYVTTFENGNILRESTFKLGVLARPYTQLKQHDKIPLLVYLAWEI